MGNDGGAYLLIGLSDQKLAQSVRLASEVRIWQILIGRM